MAKLILCLCLTAGAGLAFWSPVASANDRPALDRLLASRPKAHVRWSSFHGVKFGEPLSAAARKLHDRVESDEPRSDAHFVDFPGPPLAILGAMRRDGSGKVETHAEVLS